jgi:hypothetical protein
VSGLYQGTASQVEFAKFFVLNATVLESIIFEAEDKYYNKKFFAYQGVALQFEKRVQEVLVIFLQQDDVYRRIKSSSMPLTWI